jgi:hypothetical protein
LLLINDFAQLSLDKHAQTRKSGNRGNQWQPENLSTLPNLPTVRDKRAQLVLSDGQNLPTASATDPLTDRVLGS